MAVTDSGDESPIGPSFGSEQDEQPSRQELWDAIRDQQDQIDRMQDRIHTLEEQIDQVEHEADTIEEVARQFKRGEIGGPAGAEFLQEFVSTPPADSKVNANATKLFFKIIEERRVDEPVQSKHVIHWLDMHGLANPSMHSKRVMERLKKCRGDGHFLGDVELGKHRGQNCIRVQRADEE